MAERLAEGLRSYAESARRGRLAAEGAGAPAAPLPPEVIEELKALGYLAEGDLPAEAPAPDGRP